MNEFKWDSTVFTIREQELMVFTEYEWEQMTLQYTHLQDIKLMSEKWPRMNGKI
jgi:hypothetical protein